MPCCLIALGGNLGDVPATFAAALVRLADRDLRVIHVSRLYATPPMGAGAGGPFVNAAATLETSLDPVTLLDRLLAAEDALGRVRTLRWGPRPIDLDLILYGDVVIDAPRLRVPHPAAWYRRFVLDPLCDIAADVIHPEAGETFASLRDRLLPRPLPVAISGDLRSAVEALRIASIDATVVRPDQQPALTLRVGSPDGSAAARTIGIAADGAEADAVRAIVAAALGAPQPIEAAGWPPQPR